MEEKNSNSHYVRWIVFVWAIGLLSVGIGWSLLANATLVKKVDDYNFNFVEIKSQLSQIQTDVGWLKNSLNIKSVSK